MDVEDLHQLAGLLRARNALDLQVAQLINRPALPGHIGEWIASRIFEIELAESAVNKGTDGVFRGVPRAGASVNVKLYGKRQGLLDLLEDASADYYLVLTGPIGPPVSSRGTHRPICVHAVYLFYTQELLVRLRERGVRIGVGTSVRVADWEAAEIYPKPNNPALALTETQRYTLGLFREREAATPPAVRAPSLPRSPRVGTTAADTTSDSSRAWSTMSRGDRREAALGAAESAFSERGFAVTRQARGRAVVLSVLRGGLALEVHPRSSIGAGPAYWLKSQFEPASDRYALLVLLDEGAAPTLFLIPSLEWNQPDGVLVDRTYEYAASAPEWGSQLVRRDATWARPLRPRSCPGRDCHPRFLTGGGGWRSRLEDHRCVHAQRIGVPGLRGLSLVPRVAERGVGSGALGARHLHRGPI